jgi:hypothetical protein
VFAPVFVRTLEWCAVDICRNTKIEGITSYVQTQMKLYPAMLHAPLARRNELNESHQMAVGLARIVHLLLCHSIHFQPLLPAEDRLQKRDPVFHEKVIANTTSSRVLFKNGFSRGRYP